MVLGNNDCNCNQCLRSNPFFLYDGEQPGQSLVSDELLTGSNNHTWLPLMTLALRAKNKLGFVDGTIPKPPANDQTSAHWSCCNSMAMSWITSSVSDDIRRSVMYLKTAREMWSRLKDTYHRDDNFRVYQIRSQLRELKQQGSMDINTYFTRYIVERVEILSTVWVCQRVCTCGGKEGTEKYEQEDCLMEFLVGVNQSHRYTIDTIVTMEPLPSVCYALKRLDFEKQIQGLSSIQYHTRWPMSCSGNMLWSRAWGNYGLQLRIS